MKTFLALFAFGVHVVQIFHAFLLGIMMVTHPLVANPSRQHIQTSHILHTPRNARHEKLSSQASKTISKQRQDTHKRTHIVEGLVWHA
jgi:hypothetical protein